MVQPAIYARALRHHVLNLSWTDTHLLAGQRTVTARLDSVQDLSGSWGDCRLLLPPLSIYDAKLATSQHVLVLSCLPPGC